MGGPVVKKAVISQQAFDELVRENIDDLGMDPVEAVDDAIETLTLQGVDLSGIVTQPPNSSSLPHPVLLSLHHLSSAAATSDLLPLLDNFIRLVEQGSDDGGVSNAAAIAARNGGVEVVTSVCSKVSGSGNCQVKVSCLKALGCLLVDVTSREVFERCGGPPIIIAILETHISESDVRNACFGVIAAAATETEILKESLIHLKVDELILKALNQAGTVDPSLYDAIRALLTADDNRVAASQVFGFARRFANIGIAEALVGCLDESPSLVSACLALKAVAVNDEICRAVAEKGAVDAVLRWIDASSDLRNNKPLALASCSLLSKLAGSDQNKSSIVEKRGMERLIELCGRFSDDPSVIQEVMSIITVLSLRIPDHASRAIEAGAGDLAVQTMQKFPASQLLQKNACLMIRNLVVRNPENRKILLENGIEKIIRKAKASHKNCRDAATDALRDLGLANYNQ